MALHHGFGAERCRRSLRRRHSSRSASACCFPYSVASSMALRAPSETCSSSSFPARADGRRLGDKARDWDVRFFSEVHVKPSHFWAVPLIAVAMCTSSGRAAEEQSAQQCTAKGSEIASLMEKTELIAVTDYSGQPSEYKSDGDADTLEIVFLPRRKGTASTVSEDGEVIFLAGNVKSSERERLISLAFCRRAVARRT